MSDVLYKFQTEGLTMLKLASGTQLKLLQCM
jgi:hypothetical protein